MKKYLSLLIAFFLFNVTACTAQNNVSSTQTESKKSEISPLEELLIAFITTPDASLWKKVDDIKSIEWFDKEPKEHASKDEKKKISKSGQIMLLGFSNALLPGKKKGEIGIDNAVEGNEGESSLSLYSTLSSDLSQLGVNSIELQKYHPTQDHTKVLHNQLSKAFIIDMLTDQCADDYFTYVKFYEIHYFNYQPIYVEVYVDDHSNGYFPGGTYMVFHREEPLEQLEGYKCDINK